MEPSSFVPAEVGATEIAGEPTVAEAGAARSPSGLGPTHRFEGEARGPDPHAEASAEGPVLVAVSPGAKWTWACRTLDPKRLAVEVATAPGRPRAGDLALVRVGSLGYHVSLVAADNRKLRIYPGDLVVGVFGHRYATDAYEAEVDGVSGISFLTAGGMIGTVRSKHREMAKPTEATFLGYITDANGVRVNLKQAMFRTARGPAEVPNLIVVVGTGMNAGKTTVASQLIHSLSARGLTVAACKLTGSVSDRDQNEMRAASARSVLDFSDYGFPSTYLASAEELRDLTDVMLADSARVAPDVTVMEIADGILQRETTMILTDPEFRPRVRGILLAADSALGALAALPRLRGWGYDVLAVSGAFTSSPLYVREYEANGDVPAAPSTGDGSAIAAAVLPHLRSGVSSPPAPPRPFPRPVGAPLRLDRSSDLPMVG